MGLPLANRMSSVMMQTELENYLQDWVYVLVSLSLPREECSWAGSLLPRAEWGKCGTELSNLFQAQSGTADSLPAPRCLREPNQHYQIHQLSRTWISWNALTHETWMFIFVCHLIVNKSHVKVVEVNYRIRFVKPQWGKFLIILTTYSWLEENVRHFLEMVLLFLRDLFWIS